MKKIKILSTLMGIALLANSFTAVSIISAQAEELDITPPVSSEPDSGITIIPNTLEQLVSKDGKFENNSIIYSDRYKFALEHDEKENRDKLIVYGIPYEDTPGFMEAEWVKHLFINPECTYIENGSMDGDDTCLIYSGKGYLSLEMQDPSCKFERRLDIMFCVIDQDTYFDSTALSFDVSKYIYGVESPEKISETSPIIGSGGTDADDSIMEPSETTIINETEITTTNPCDTPDIIPDGENYGDVSLDGKVNIADVVALNLYIMNSNSNRFRSTACIANADCVRDNVINTADSTLLMNYVSELISIDQLGKKSE